MKWIFTLGLAALLSACTAVPRPEGSNHAASCHVPSTPVQAVVVAVHGLNDHRGAFTDLAQQLMPAGVALYSYDQRGFGDTPGRGGWAGAETLAEDLRQLTRELARRHPGRPLYVLGESMGAAVAILAAGGVEPWPVAGLILSGPALLDERVLAPYQRDVLDLLAALFPDLAVSPPADVTVTDDPLVAERLQEDPWILPYTRLEVLAGVVHLMESAQRVAPRVRLPVLILYGARDPVIPPDAVERLADRLGGPVTRVRYRAGYHLLLRGERAVLSADRVGRWLRERTGEPPGVTPTAASAHRIRCGCQVTRVHGRPALSECATTLSGRTPAPPG